MRIKRVIAIASFIIAMAVLGKVAANADRTPHARAVGAAPPFLCTSRPGSCSAL